MSTVIVQIATGFFVKGIASFDDTLTRIPMIAELTRTKKGRVAFSIGTISALTVIVTLAILFSNILNQITFRNQIIALLILVLSILVYFEVFINKSQRKVEKSLKKVKARSVPVVKLISIGFIISFVTLIDDMIILTPLFGGEANETFFSLVGVYLATIIQIIIVIYFGGKITKFKYKKEIASFALIILAILVWNGMV
jgi:Kef-type K+ transport system membrane component KefB